MSKSNTVISYAFREADGIDNLINFLDSLILFNVMEDIDIQIALKESSEIFHNEVKQLVQITQKRIPRIKIIHIPSGGYDIGTHYFIAINSTCQILILMSASSKVNKKNWDKLLLKKFEDPEVGIVGSMYSKESVKTSYLEILDLILKSKLKIKLNQKEQNIAEIRELKFKNHKISIKENYFSKKLLNFCRNLIIYAARHKEPFNYIDYFPEFPNPHLRTTGFAIRRELLISVIDEIPEKKSDTFICESGYQSITRRSLSLGWRVLVLGANQKYYDFDDKNINSTFRVQKVDSIVTDNESRSFHRITPRKQRLLSSITHG